MYFVPITKDLPLFGRQAARKWLWTFSLSPGFFGSGIIMGPEIGLHMLTGAIVGWGILSPYAKANGWAPGDVGDWETGSRGWLVWIGLACLMADTLVKMFWIYLKVIWEKYGHLLSRAGEYDPFWRREQAGRPHGYFAVGTNSDTFEPSNRNIECRVDETEYTTTPTPKKEDLHPHGGYLLTAGFLVSILVCIFATQSVFGDKMPSRYTFVSILLAFPAAITSIRGLAESDYNAGSSLGTSASLSLLCPHLLFEEYHPWSNSGTIWLTTILREQRPN